MVHGETFDSVLLEGDVLVFVDVTNRDYYYIFGVEEGVVGQPLPVG